MSYLSDIATYLQTQGIGTKGTDLFYANVPAKMDTGVVVLDTGGPLPDPDIPTKNPTFQVFIRANTYALGDAKRTAVRDALHRLGNQLLGSTYFFNILAVSEGGHIGRNEAGRDEFSINFQSLIR